MKNLFNLNKKVQNIPKNFSRPFLLTALCLSILVIGLYELETIQAVEFTNYDLLFYLKQRENIDERITIVSWNEESINSLDEPIISDVNLNKLINVILDHNPKVLGLDLHRNEEVTSPKISKAANSKAYNSLNQTLRENSNIFGVHKVVAPKIEPSPILEQEQRSAASDFSSAKNIRLRQSYIFPSVDKNENPVGVPYIGVVLGYQYLKTEGWSADNVPREVKEDEKILGLEIHKDQKSFILKPLKPKLRQINSLDKDSNWRFFLNWRKTEEHNSFKTISVSEIFKNQSNFDSLFRNKLVIIGNTNHSYGSDIHHTTLDRWQKSSILDNWQDRHKMTGVEIVAQVSSSIISKAIDNRNIIYPVSRWIIYISILLPLYVQARICENHLNANISFNKLKWKILLPSFVFVISQVIICFFSFNIYGIWFSISPSIIAVIFGSLVFFFMSNSQKEKLDFYYLQLLMKDFKHNIRGVSRQIASANRAINRNNNKIIQIAHDYNSFFEEYDDEGIELLENALNENTNAIISRNTIIDKAIIRINTYQERTTSYLNYTYSNAIDNTKIEDLNFKISNIINNFVRLEDNDFHYVIEPHYDDEIKPQKLHIDDWLILIENLLSNAVYAINPELNSEKNFEPKIIVNTINEAKNISLVVQDNGVGIPQEFQKQVFFPFISFKEGRGDGMGLHLVSQVVNCRKGKLLLESKPLQGTKITITLPKIH